jgi:RNA recognition motif-containing protein
MDIFVGSLSFKLKESELREAFEKYGKVSSAKIIIDKITRQSKGFGFIEMPDEVEARAAINALNGADMYGRPLVVNESQKREPRSDSGAPRPDTRNREGFNRPRPAGNDAPGSRTPYTADRNTGRDYARPAVQADPTFASPTSHARKGITTEDMTTTVTREADLKRKTVTLPKKAAAVPKTTAAGLAVTTIGIDT